MATGIGNLVVRLGLDAVDYTTGLTRSEREAKKAADKITKDLSKIAEQLGPMFLAAGAAVSVGLGLIVKQSIDAADHLNDLSKTTGIAVETLGGLGFAATMAGGDLETVAAAAGKLNKSIAGAAAGNQEYQEGFKALGIDVRDATGKLKTADQVLVEIADKFQGFADGPEKAALAIRLMSRAGADQIPLLNEGGKALQDSIDLYKQYSGVTQEVADKADKFNDTVAKLQLLAGSFGRSLAAELLPNLQKVVDLLLESKQNGEGFEKWAERTADLVRFLARALVSTTYTFDRLGDSIGAAAAKAKSYATLDFKGVELIDEAQVRKQFRMWNDYQKTLAALRREQEKPAPLLTGKPTDKPDKPPAPLLVENTSKKILDNAMKAFDRQVSQEGEILASRNRMLDLYNSESLISFKEYYAGRQVALDENTKSTLAIYDKEIAAATKARNAASGNERGELSGKINELLDKKAKLTRAAGEETVTQGFKETKAYEDLARRITDINAQLLDLAGNTAAAAQLRFAAQFADVRDRLSAEGDQSGLDQVDALERALTAQAEFNEVVRQGADAQARLSNVEGAIISARDAGNESELGALAAISRARKGALKDMEAVVIAQEAIARASENDVLILQAETARAAFERFGDQVDLVGDKFKQLERDAFADAFTDFIAGTKTASDAFRAFGQSVINQLARIAAQEAATAIFGGKGSGGIGGILGAVGGFFDSEAFSSILLSGGLANGGYAAPGSLHEVNERGPELLETNGRQFLMMGSQGGTVTPNNALRGAGSEGAPLNLTIVNNTSARIGRVTEQRLSPNERALIIEEAIETSAAQFANPNSKMSRAVSQNFKAPRNRM